MVSLLGGVANGFAFVLCRRSEGGNMVNRKFEGKNVTPKKIKEYIRPLPKHIIKRAGGQHLNRINYD